MTFPRRLPPNGWLPPTAAPLLDPGFDAGFDGHTPDVSAQEDLDPALLPVIAALARMTARRQRAVEAESESAQ